MKHIIIVGGQYTGVGTAHRFLKEAKNKTNVPFKVTLVSCDSHFYWNIASPRGLVPGRIPEEELFQPIAEGFRQYGDRFDFLLGTATKLDHDGQTLKVVDSIGVERNLRYDVLVLATGARTKDETPFKSSGSTESVRRSLRNYHSRIGKAKTIAVVGAGTTGVETAGELAGLYGAKKKIILVGYTPMQGHGD